MGTAFLTISGSIFVSSLSGDGEEESGFIFEVAVLVVILVLMLAVVVVIALIMVRSRGREEIVTAEAAYQQVEEPPAPVVAVIVAEELE